ncbi:hypothetical protein M426DRAFT_11419 [Hypoxylon sp. CI-4A]|nr:hypothetical protein M426DRAFT_11419 [Hypoxylon sp. CI-4A]
MSDYINTFNFDYFDDFPDSAEYAVDLSIPDPIGQEQNPTPYFDLPSLPDATAVPVDPPMRDTNTQAEVLNPQYISILDVPVTRLEEGASSLDQTVSTETNQQVHDPLYCVNCQTSFETRKELRRHAREEQHNVIGCLCGKTFSRPDALIRHCDKKDRKFPCTFCKRHRDEDSFHRQDHLAQHLRGYHKLEEERIITICGTTTGDYNVRWLQCPQPACEFHRGGDFDSLSWEEQEKQKPFQTRGEYTRHLKDVHNASPFHCPVQEPWNECQRVGAKGYATAQGLRKHLVKDHPNASQHYLADLRAELNRNDHTCEICKKRFFRWELDEFNLHRQLAHQS